MLTEIVNLSAEKSGLIGTKIARSSQQTLTQAQKRTNEQSLRIRGNSRWRPQNDHRSLCPPTYFNPRRISKPSTLGGPPRNAL